MVILNFGAWLAGETRQLAQGDVDAQRRGLVADGAYPVQELVVEVGVLDEIEVQRLRRDVGGDPIGQSRGAVGKGDADGTLVLDDHAGRLGIGFDLDAEGLCFRIHRLGDRSHAADRVPPGATYPVEFTEGVVEQAVGGPGRIGRGEIADHGVEGEGGLDVVVLEEDVEQVPDRLKEEVSQIPAPGHG